LATSGHSKDGSRGGFQFGEWHADARGISRDLQILAAAAQIQQQRRGSHANAIAALLSGDPDAAINLLERIGVESGTSASVASDLAAARLARWRQNGDAFDAVRALNEAGRAIAAQRNLAEAWFNRALALDALGLTELGRDAWRQYRDIDPSTQWSNEAAQRGERDRRDASGVSSPGGRDPLVRALAIQDLAAIRTIVNQSPQTARDYIESDLLGRWVDDHLRSLRQEDTRQGADMRLLGRLLAERHGDMLWQRMSEELDAVPRPGQAAVAQAIHRFLAARSHIEANRFDAVAPIVARLPSQLMAVPSLARSARFWALYVAWHRQNKSSIIAALSRLSTEAAAHRFGYLRARTLLLRAASMESLARYDDASQAFRDSIEEFDKLGEIEFAASGRAMLAHLLAVQGDLTEAWEQQRSALGALGRIDSSRRKIVVLANAVLLGTHHDLPYAALDIQSALIAEARRWGDHGALARYFVERARLSNDLHMPVEADAALQAGSEALRGIEDVSNRAIFELDLQIEGARALMNSNPVDASRALTNAIERLPNNSGEFKLAELYLDLGRAKRRTRRVERSAAGLAERYRRLRAAASHYQSRAASNLVLLAGLGVI
jgi:tetratricopeptide (TPR) repeat protein